MQFAVFKAIDSQKFGHFVVDSNVELKLISSYLANKPMCPDLVDDLKKAYIIQKLLSLSMETFNIFKFFTCVIADYEDCAENSIRVRIIDHMSGVCLLFAGKKGS